VRAAPNAEHTLAPMPTTYQPLCRVQLCHDYFTSGVLTSLLATPTPATAKRLRQAGLLFRAQPDGFSLLYDTSSIYQPLSKLEPLFPLLFGLTATDSCFTTYSDLPLVPVTPTNTYCLRLAPGAPPDRVGSRNLLPLLPLVSTQPLPPRHLAGTAQLLAHPPGPAAPVWPVAASATTLPLDLRPWGSGYYTLRTPAQNLTFYADDFLCHSRPWGLLELGAAVLTAPHPPVYTIRFAARSTYWQYQFTPRQAPLPKLRITGAAPLTFRPAAPLTGAVASYRASQPIRLAQRYALGPYQLHAAADSPFDSLLIPALPQAGPSSLRLETPAAPGKAPRYISDIFVQV
jgi:hypothetical protein